MTKVSNPSTPVLERSSIITDGKRVIDLEIEALAALSQNLGESFADAVQIVLACKGRVVVAGMGKSGQICRKMAATMSSTGTSALFLHAAEAAHGDLGMLTRGDVCIAISYSGTTNEVVELIEPVKRLSIPLVAITANADSPLAQAADAVLNIGVKNEACPMNLAPTASTTATLAIGDALAVAVLQAKGFGPDDFAKLHPGGALGRGLMKVDELMHAQDSLPLVELNAEGTKTMRKMTSGGLGTVGVVTAGGELVGVVTDGDLRRAMLHHESLKGLLASDIMSGGPKTVRAGALAVEALALMETHSITSLFVIGQVASVPVGIIHLHDLLRAGVA